MKIKIFSIMFLWSSLMAFSFVSYGQVSTLSNKDKQNSIQFKALKGQDRLAVFQQLQTLIRLKQTNGNNLVYASSRMGAKPCNEADLTELLGTPDKKIGTSLLMYFLKSGNTNCKLLVGLDKEGYVVFSTIKDCN